MLFGSWDFAPAAEVAKAAVRDPSNFHWSILTLFAIVMIVYCDEIKAKNYLKEQEINRIEQELEQEKLKAEELEEYSKFVNTKQFVEMMAREKFGLIYPGELIFKAE